MSLVRKELIEGIKIKQYHDFFDYVTKDYLSSGDFIDLYSDSGSDEQIKMWSQGDFNSNIMEESVSIADSNGYAVAKHYRMLRTSNAFTNDGVENTSNNITSLERLIEIVKTINTFELDNQYTKDFLSWLKEKELLTDFTSSQNLARGQGKVKSLCFLTDFAPYTAYVYTITLLSKFNLFSNTDIKRKLNDKDSDWMDINYIFYFPFIDSFATDDEIFIQFLKQFKI